VEVYPKDLLRGLMPVLGKDRDMNLFSSFNLGCLAHASFACFCLSVSTSSSRAGVDIINDEIISKWKAYELFARNLQGTARETTTPDTGKTERRLLVYKSNRECVTNIISNEQGSTDICRIGNPRYAASVKRSKLDPSQVSLEKITLSPNGPFPGYAGENVSLFDLTRSLISPHFRIRNMPLCEILHAPSFTILNVLNVSEKGQELVRIDYRYSHRESTVGAETKGHGSVFLDPSQCWCISRSKSSAASTQKGIPRTNGEEEIEYETIRHASGFPLVKAKIQHVNTYNFKAQKRIRFTKRIEYQWEVNDGVPDSEFILSAFGLPEPMGVEPLPPPRTWIWLITAMVGAVLLAILFAWLKHRHAKATPAKN
jgi:hypothetical protein